MASGAGCSLPLPAIAVGTMNQGCCSKAPPTAGQHLSGRSSVGGIAAAAGGWEAAGSAAAAAAAAAAAGGLEAARSAGAAAAGQLGAGSAAVSTRAPCRGRCSRMTSPT